MVHYKSYLPETGVVVGGYGDTDYYPGIEAFECYGFLDRQFICNSTGEPTQVNKDLPAAIEPFATTSMINTFRMGIGPDIFGNVVAATKNVLREFANKIRQDSCAWRRPPPILRSGLMKRPATIRANGSSVQFPITMDRLPRLLARCPYPRWRRWQRA